MSYLYDPTDEGLELKLKIDHPEFGDLPHADFDKVIRYAIYMYDKGSEYRTTYKDYSTRKRECAIKAGFKINKATRRFENSVEDILVGEDETANQIIVNYIKIQNDPQLFIYTSFSELLATETKNSLEEKDSKIIKAIRESMEKLQVSLLSLENNIFGGREVVNMRRSLYQTLMTENNIPRPETVARAIHEGNMDLGVDTYYGS